MVHNLLFDVSSIGKMAASRSRPAYAVSWVEYEPERAHMTAMSVSLHAVRPARKAVTKSAASAASPEGFPSRDPVGR